MKHWVWFLVLLTLISETGLAQQPNRTRHTDDPRVFVSDNYCHATPAYGQAYDSLWAVITRRDTVFSKAVQGRFSKRSRSVAADLGIIELLDRFAALEQTATRDPTLTNRLNLMTLRQQIQERISVGTLELSGVLIELECEQDRAIELKNYLDTETGTRTNRRTIVSIVSGALTAVVSGVLTLAQADDRITQGLAIGGSAFSSYWGFRALKGEAFQSFSHRRNHLRDIVENPSVSQVYPPVVWHFISRELEGLPTVREVVVERWQELDLLGGVSAVQRRKRYELVFGNGGKYDVDDANVRISLIDLLESEVGLMNQEMKQLQQELLLPNKQDR
ncbi:MAG: hypothetical protein LH606_12325 [Cytophagaceae bacterium]|nr:hypothetical protein [Cytophagaceae bacterium]